MAEKINNLSFVTHKGRQIRQVPTELSRIDRLGHWKARWGLGRMKYVVEPGIYAVDSPDSDSPVFVSANYKMSFDCLRSQLGARNGWILVLDTKGINVWCAAGKGTFGTDELVNRIKTVKLAEIVNHRTLVVPQLGATGVSAHEVKQRSDFRVLYGPVRAEDLPAFLDAGMKTTEQMRWVNFTLWNRMVLIPVEIVMWSKYAIFAAACFFLLAGLNKGGYSISLAMNDGLVSAILLLVSFLAAAIFGPILLPWLPGRAFSVKGVWIGLAVLSGLGFYSCGYSDILSGRLNTIAWLLIIPTVTSFMVMSFTGASTYTSLSGVRKEMRMAVPLQLLCAVSGIGLWLAGRFA
ncbi:MAG: mercury methylation corrinoid protein HgcA [Planctomycetota bacterium]|jgi:acetyl-CoA decarbonylase/synthase complex subunit gamma